MSRQTILGRFSWTAKIFDCWGVQFTGSARRNFSSIVSSMATVHPALFRWGKLKQWRRLHIQLHIHYQRRSSVSSGGLVVLLSFSSLSSSASKPSSFGIGRVQKDQGSHTHTSQTRPDFWARDFSSPENEVSNSKQNELENNYLMD